MKRNPTPGFSIVPSHCFLLVTLLLSCHQLFAQTKYTPAATVQKALPAYSYKIIAAVHGTFGYDIYRDNRLEIHQPNIPALIGNDGFKTKAAAEKVAALVISKMKKGETLPAVSITEMQKLHVLLK